MLRECRMCNLNACTTHHPSYQRLVGGGCWRFCLGCGVKAGLPCVRPCAGPAAVLYVQCHTHDILCPLAAEEACTLCPAGTGRPGVLTPQSSPAPGTPPPTTTTSLTAATTSQGDIVVPSSGVRTFQELNLEPHSVTQGHPVDYLRHYRVGGYDFGTTAGGQPAGGAAVGDPVWVGWGVSVCYAGMW